MLVSLPILAMAGATLVQVLLLALASHLVGAWAATVFDYWNGHYFVWGAAFAFFLGVTLLVPLVAIALSRISEIAAILFGRGPAPPPDRAGANRLKALRRKFRSMFRPTRNRRKC